MATYLIAFRIDYDGTYTNRWSSVVDAIRAQADYGKTWEEMTSVIVLQSSKSAEDLARAIYFGSDFSAATDRLLVVNTLSGSYAVRGKIDDPSSLSAIFGNGSNALLSALLG